MVRHLYGPVLIGTPGTGSSLNIETAALPASEDQGATIQTDLQTPAGAAITQVTPDATTGAAAFKGRDGYAGTMWLQDPGTSVWWPVFPSDLSSLQGTPGSNGRGITSIARTVGTGAPGTTDTYTITYTDASTSTFTIKNGSLGVSNIFIVRWFNGAAAWTPADPAYTSIPGSAPTGIAVRIFLGPSPYTGAAWSGVDDIYLPDAGQP